MNSRKLEWPKLCIFHRSATDICASLVEKAYAQIQASGVITGNTVNDGNSFSTIGNGGSPEYTLEEITGASSITDFDAIGSSWSKYVYNDVLATQSAIFGLTTASVLATLISDRAEGNDAVLSSETNATDNNGMDTLIADHAMSIYGYDSTTGDLEIRNPWGIESGQYWNRARHARIQRRRGERLVRWHGDWYDPLERRRRKRFRGWNSLRPDLQRRNAGRSVGGW